MPTCCSVAPSGLLSRAQRHTWRKKARSRGDLSKVLLEATRRTNSSRSAAASGVQRGTGSFAGPIWVNSLLTLTRYHSLVSRERGPVGPRVPAVEPRVYTCDHRVSAVGDGSPRGALSRTLGGCRASHSRGRRTESLGEV